MHPTNTLTRNLSTLFFGILFALTTLMAGAQTQVFNIEDFNGTSPNWTLTGNGSQLLSNSFPSVSGSIPNRWIIGSVPPSFASVDGSKALYISCNATECGDNRPEFKSIPDDQYATNIAATRNSPISPNLLSQGGNLFLEFNWIFPKQGPEDNAAGARLIYSTPQSPNGPPGVWREVNQTQLLKSSAVNKFSIKLSKATLQGYDSTKGLYIGFRWYNAALATSDNSLIIDDIRVVLKPTLNMLSISPQAPVPVCSGSQININTDISGFPAGTTFSAQLSTPFGDFSNPYNLGPVVDGLNSLVIPVDRITSSDYKIRITTSGNLNSDTLSLVINKLPDKPLAGGDLILCSAPEDPVTIGSEASNEEQVLYSWNIPNLAPQDNTFHTFNVGDANLINNGLSPQIKQFVVTATVAGNTSCQNYDTVLVKVYPKPQISTISVQGISGDSPYPICDNVTPVQLSVTILPGSIQPPGTSTGVWAGAGIISGPSNTRFFSPSGLTGSNTLTYTHTIKWTATGPSCKTEKQIIFDVKAPPVADAGTTAKVCQNEAPVQLVGGTNPGSLLWFGNGVSNGGLFDPSTVSIPSSATSRTVSCSLVVSAVNTCRDTAVKFITVFKPPVVYAGSDDTICQSTPKLLLLGYSPLASGPPSTGTWTGSGVVDGSTQNPAFKPGVGTGQVNVLTYTFKDVNGCKNFDDKVVYVLPDPVASAGENGEVCSGKSTIVGSSSQPHLVYEWYSPPAAFFSRTDTSFASLTLTNNFGTTAQDVKARLRVKDTITGCTSIDSVTIKVKPIPQATLFLPSDTTACEGSTIRLKANLTGLPTGTNFKFQWFRDGFPLTLINDSSGYNAGLSGNYKVAMSIGNFGCFDTSSVVSLRFYPNIKPRIVGDTNFCGSSPTLLRAVPANAAFAYEWKLRLPKKDGSGDSISIILPGTPIAAVEVSKKGKLIVNMLSDKGCEAQSDTITISQLAQPVVVTDKRNATFCDNDGFTFSTMDSSAFKYRWLDSANRNVILEEKSKFEPKVAGTYYLEVYNKCGIASDTFRVFQIFASPQFGILQNGKRDTTVCLNQPYSMQGPSGYLLYRWFVPKKIIDTATNEVIISADTISRGLSCDSGLLVTPEQSYRLTLLIKDRYNCENQDSIRVFVSQCQAQLFVPNAFRPNPAPQTPEEMADNNKRWYIAGYGIASVKWYIYNRWGEMVASGTDWGDPTLGWDGTHQNPAFGSSKAGSVKPDCPTGTYKYVIEYMSEKDNITRKLAGNLTLIRIR